MQNRIHKLCDVYIVRHHGKPSKIPKSVAQCRLKVGDKIAKQQINRLGRERASWHAMFLCHKVQQCHSSFSVTFYHIASFFISASDCSEVSRLNSLAVEKLVIRKLWHVLPDAWVCVYP